MMGLPKFIKKINIVLPEKREMAVMSIVALPLEGPISPDKGVFHENELRYFEGLKFEKRKMEYYLGRVAAKLAISEYYEPISIPREKIEIAQGISSQPVIKSEQLFYSKP